MLRLLLALYYPFVAIVLAATIGLTVLLAVWVKRGACLWMVYVGAFLVLLATLGHALFALRVLFVRPKETPDPLELKLTREKNGVAFAWVDEIAATHRLVRPDQIRIAADAIAHVYETDAGQNVLVLGGMAVATFTKAALAGIVAHELAHFTHGDTALGRRAAKKFLLMNHLEAAFFAVPGGVLNPIALAVVGYHRLVARAYFAHSRQQEEAADRWEVEQAGAEVAGATLVHLHVTPRMPWVRLTSVVESAIAQGQPVPKDVFDEQVRRAKTASRDEWERVLKKELATPTGPYDSHPALKDRLKAIGVSPKKALAAALDTDGEPATAIFPAWTSLQAKLSARLTALAFERHRAIQETGAILRGLG
jgi:Zn-dependent protease with chaperone function